MLCPRVGSKLCSPAQVAQLGRAAAPLLHKSPLGIPAGLRLAAVASQQHGQHGPALRSFSTTSVVRMKDFFPASETEHIRQTLPAWPHHGYSYQEMVDVTPGHRAPVTVGEKVAWMFVKVARWAMDLATGVSSDQRTDKKHPTTAVTAMKPLTEKQWFIRFIFLESIAGVPGMVAGMLRHLHSIRRLKRDNGWIETLLEESYNERMHLLTFMKMCEPGWFMKIMILGAQGVYFNAMFLAYLVSPKVCHRFVGYLEEEAVHTYTRCLKEIDAGAVPKWSDPNFKIPEIAIKYWKMPEDHRTMKDLILYIRADEAGHRGVNHTLGNLNQKEDPNPFVSEYKTGKPAPKAFERPQGYEREEVI